ncbi:polysaccharide pyruvyl transferase CsaB [Clostridiaceae bacterium 35-E11]
MHKIIISGYYGFNNIGDESILTSIVDNLKERIEDIEITVLSVNPQSTSERHKVHAIDRKNMKQVYHAIKKCDVLISGGGSLLQDVTSRRSISYYLVIMLIAILLRKKVMIYSQGIGPINRHMNKYFVQWVLNKVDCITVRDEKSHKLLQDIGVHKPPIYVTADPVMSLKKGNIEIGKKRLLKEGMQNKKEKPLIGFAIRGWQKNEKLKENIAKTADKLIENYGAQVAFIPFHFGEDMKMMEDIEETMMHKAIFIKNKYDIYEMLGIVGNLDLLIGVRLHSLIFAAIMNIPMIAISYDPKIDSFMESLGLSTLCSVDELAYEDLLLAIENKRNQSLQDKEVLRYSVEKIQKKLEINEKLLKDLLRQGAC